MDVLKRILLFISKSLTVFHIAFRPESGISDLRADYSSLKELRIRDNFLSFNIGSILITARYTIESLDLEGVLLTPDRATDLAN